jgi:hypothetical protein
MNRRIIIFLFIFIAAGCGHQESKHVYDEVVIESSLKAKWEGTGDPHASLHSTTAGAPMSGVLDPELLKSAAQIPLTWKAPSGWQEFPGSGFRLVTFKAGEGEDAIECSIVSLSGEAGGIEANLVRWMTQINLKAPSDGVLEFLKNEHAFTPSPVQNMPMDLVDFTALQKDSPDTTPSMYVHIINTPEATIFIKMTGTIKAIKKHAPEFFDLSTSIRLKK